MLLAGAVSLLSWVGGCGSERLSPELAELSARLEVAARTASLSGDEGRALAEELTDLFADPGSICDGCSVIPGTISDPAGGGLSFAVRTPQGETIAELHLLYRPDLRAEQVAGWAQRSFDGHPAAGFEGEHLFVWPGRVEIRAFARSHELGGAEGLERVVALLPLDILEQL